MKNLSSLSKARLAAAGAGIAALPLFLPLPAWPFAMVTAGLAFWSVHLLRKSEQEIVRLQDICQRLAKGDFEARIIGITEAGNLGALALAINRMTDAMDSFVREATAAMDYVSHNQYFRRILEGGMQGALLHGARTINTATRSVAKKMSDFSGIATDFEKSFHALTGDLQATVQALQSSSGVMQNVVAGVRTETESAVASSDNSSGSVQSISSAAEELSASIKEISQQMSRTSGIADTANRQADTAESTLANLSERAQKIGEVIQLIETIAKQTNLLALNATIEASRAGDAGKGFAVVASEVKQLADQTAKATINIAEQIRNMQDITDATVHAFRDIKEGITNIHAAASAVAAAVEEQSAVSQEIARGSESASTGTQAVARNVGVIRDRMDEVGDATHNVMHVTERLSQQSAARLNEMMAKMQAFMEGLRKIA